MDFVPVVNREDCYPTGEAKGVPADGEARSGDGQITPEKAVKKPAINPLATFIMVAPS